MGCGAGSATGVVEPSVVQIGLVPPEISLFPQGMTVKPTPRLMIRPRSMSIVVRPQDLLAPPNSPVTDEEDGSQRDS